MTRKIYKKLLLGNSEEGKMKCVPHCGQALVSSYLKREAGVALEPGETVTVKYTENTLQSQGTWPIVSKAALGYAVAGQAVQTPMGQNILKQEKVVRKIFKQGTSVLRVFEKQIKM